MAPQWREILRSNIGPETLISISLAGPLGPEEYEMIFEYLRLMKRIVTQPVPAEPASPKDGPQRYIRDVPEISTFIHKGVPAHDAGGEGER